jgi:hypothetical protein
MTPGDIMASILSLPTHVKQRSTESRGFSPTGKVDRVGLDKQD